MKKEHYAILVSLLALTLICPRAWPGVAGDVQAAPDVGTTTALTQLSGRVYEGPANTEPPTSTGMGGVTVRLYGATQPDTMYGDLLATTTTNPDGWYGLDFNEVRYSYYNIVETDPSTHYSVWASSVGGARKDNDWIQYTAPISGTGKVTTGNKFWDLPRVSPTPTRTRTPTRMPSPTHTPAPPTRTATPTATRPLADTATPTATRPAGPTATATATLPPVCDYLQPDFSRTPKDICDRWPVDLYDSSTTVRGDPIVAWQWDFGDGYTGHSSHELHQWAQPGVYQVTLTVTTQSGCQGSITGALTVFNCSMSAVKQCISHPSGTALVGDTISYTIAVSNTGNLALGFDTWDEYPMAELEYVSAAPVPWFVLPTTYSPGVGRIQWHQVPIQPGQQESYTVTFRAKSTGQNVCDLAVASATILPIGASQYGRVTFSTPACLDIVEPQGQLTVTKTLIDPASGIAQVGDVVRFLIEARNLGTAAMTDFDIWDTFLDADYEFVSASPAPSNNTSDGTERTLMWDNLSLPGGGVFAILLELRTKGPGVLKNCAMPIEWVEVNCVHTVLEPVPGPASCASVRVDPPEGRHFRVWKKFTVPSNHVANLGDSVAFETGCKITGSEPAVRIDLFDHIAPPSVSPLLPLNFAWLSSFQTGDSATAGLAFQPQSVASPAVNTAEWTVTWPDGTKETKAAQDYLYIVDGQIGKGLFIDKWLGEPLPDAAISDTVTFHIAITNVTGLGLPVLPLEDTFPAQCLSFSGASRPPDSGTPGKLAWSNIGPLPLGESVQLDVRFHADAVCPAALNCASVTYELPGAGPRIVADCEPVTIGGEQPRLMVSKQRTSPSPAHVGDWVTWQIVLQNAGTAPLSVMPLHDAYQSTFLEYHSAVPLPDSIDLMHGRLDWANLGPLHPGQSVTVTLTLLAHAPGVAVLNCAESTYTVGSSTFTPSDCDTVDIVAPGAAIGVEKVLAWPGPAQPLAVGDAAAFTVTVRNTGAVTLTNVVVEDHFDTGCMSFVPNPAMPPMLPAPGQLRWTLPSLNPGEQRSWQVLFHVDNPCAPTDNCAVATGDPPEGPPVLAEDCVPLAIEAPQPGLLVRKALVAPSHVPQVGDVIEYELLVTNAGNMTLMTVEVTDSYDPACLEYVGAIPAPDTVDSAAGQMRWFNVGPLAPSDTATLRVSLRGVGTCAFAANCAEARWLVAGVPELVVSDCVEVPVRGAAVETPTPTATPTLPGQATPTSTATRPGDLTPTPTATRAPGDLTPTPTATGEGALHRLFLPIIMKGSLVHSPPYQDHLSGRPGMMLYRGRAGYDNLGAFALP